MTVSSGIFSVNVLEGLSLVFAIPFVACRPHQSQLRASIDSKTSSSGRSRKQLSLTSSSSSYSSIVSQPTRSRASIDHDPKS